MRVLVVDKAEDIPFTPVDDKPTLVYWNIEGLCQSIRLTLVQAGVDFVDVRINPGIPGDDNYKKAWMVAKEKLNLSEGLTFPNLPYYIDGEVHLSQSDAILRYLGRKYDLMGVPGKEYLVDMALDELKDLDIAMLRLAYREGEAALVEWFEKDMPAKLDQWTGLLEKGDHFLTGSKVSIADMKLYAFLYKLNFVQNESNQKHLLKDLNLQRFMQTFEALPNIAEYIKSPDYLRTPLNNPHAKWGNK